MVFTNTSSHFDLPIALGLLLETKQIKSEKLQSFGFIGELSLNARLRACTGILPMAIRAKESGINNIVVPKDNIKEASLVQGANVYGFDTLRQVVDFLEDNEPYQSSICHISQETGVDPQKVDFKRYRSCLDELRDGKRRG